MAFGASELVVGGAGALATPHLLAQKPLGSERRERQRQDVQKRPVGLQAVRCPESPVWLEGKEYTKNNTIRDPSVIESTFLH